MLQFRWIDIYIGNIFFGNVHGVNHSNTIEPCKTIMERSMIKTGFRKHLSGIISSETAVK